MRAVDRHTWTNCCSSFNSASDPWPRTDPRPFAQILLDDELRRGLQPESSYPINRAQGEHHDRHLHLRRLFAASMASAPTAATAAATGASKAPSCSPTASVNTY